MKCLVTGCNGLLGQKLMNCAPADAELLGVDLQPEPVVSGAGYQRVDLGEGEQVLAMVRQFRPDWILNAAAFTDVDGAEENKSLCRRVNVTAVEHLVAACLETGARLLHISTDYVFDGRNGPYGEQDPPNPLGYYGRSKWAGECALQHPSLHAVIARTMVLYGLGQRVRPNFVTWLIAALRKGQSVRIVTDQFGNTTLADELAEALWRMAALECRGLYHVAGSEIVDRYTFAVKIAKIFDLDTDRIQPITTADLAQQAPRPLKSGLLVDKALNELGVRLSDVETGLRRLREQFQPLTAAAHRPD